MEVKTLASDRSRHRLDLMTIHHDVFSLWKRCCNLIVLASRFNHGLGCKTFAHEPGEVALLGSWWLSRSIAPMPQISELAETIGIGKDCA